MSLARRGATVTGIDFSSEAVGFARQLASATDAAATFQASDALGALEAEPRPGTNTIGAQSFQYTLADTVTALAGAGLVVETLHEWPHSNGARVTPALVRGPGRTWIWPAGVARLPLMFGIAVRRPS